MSEQKSNKSKATRHYVEDRLIALRNLKEQYNLQSKSYEWRQKANMKEVNEVQWEDFRTQISSVVKYQKDADLASALPEYEFMPENEAWRKNRKIVREAFNYWWTKSWTDKQVAQVAQSATTNWTGILFEWIKHIYKTINVPFFNKDEEIEFKKEKKLMYSGIYCKKIPFANFFINWDDIENATEAIVIEYHDMDWYLAEKKESNIYKNLWKVKKSSKEYTLVSDLEWEDATADWDENNTVVEITYYNSAKDEYIILANWIEILKSHIPYEHKELPFCLFIDNAAEDRIWGIWEYELLEQSERTKNELRTLLISGTKASIWFILKDIDTDFEETDIQTGVWQVFEVSDIEWIKHFAQSVPIQAITQAEQKIDNDIIILSWEDIQSLQTTSETATKTAWKSVSSKKRINKNIKDNAYDFYTRLAYLRMKNIQFLHKMKVREIPIKGWSIRNDWVFVKDEANSFGSAKIWQNLIEWEFLVTPLTETMIWDNKQRRKDNASLYVQTWGSIMWEDWKPVLKWVPLAELITEEYGYDFDKMTQAQSTSKSWEDILNDLLKEQSWISMDATNPASPDFIPPEQRSGAAKRVATPSWQAATAPEDLIA